MMRPFVSICGVSIAAALTLSIAGGREAANKPLYGSWGFDSTGEDTSVKPGDDFFAFANGTWLKNTPIPVDKSRVFAFTIIGDRIEERLREMMEGAAAETTHRPRDLRFKIGAFYKAFMNETQSACAS